ncbi:MAG: hypothetical protein ACE15B_04655 [Bryobacteraceae bacterium]
MKSRFWPFDFDQDEAIYENLTWDLPGITKKSARPRPGKKSPRRQARRGGK